jgi:PAS domain S-box-containing protein
VSSQNDAVVIGFLADAAAIFDADRVLVLLYDFDRGLASEVAEWVRPGIAPRGLSLHSIPLEKVPADVRQTHRQGEPYWIPDVPAFPEGGAKPGLVSAGIRSALAVPLMDGSECFGFVGFDWTRALHVPEPGEPLRIKLFAALLANLLRRQWAEAAARESEARLRAITESFTDGMIYQVAATSGTGRRFTFLSRSVTQLYGITPEQGMTDASLIYSRIHPDDLAQLARLEEEAIRERKPLRAEVRVRNPDDSIRWSSFVSTPKLQDDGSMAWNGVEFVITPRKQAEEALRLQEERLRLALEATNDAVWDWDLATNQTFFSPRWHAILGYPAEAAAAPVTFSRALIHPEDLDGVVAASTQAIREGTGYTVEARMRCADGSWRWIQSRGMVTARDAAGRATRVSGVNTDIHARRVAEQEKARIEAQFVQAQKIESVGRLAGGVAHDFNNMLGVILACAESALEQTPAEPVREELEEILAAARRSAELTRQLLAFARKQPVAPRTLDLNQAVGDTLKMLQRLIGEDIELQWQPGSGLWPVRLDPSQLDQVLANLCVNSRDAMGDIGRITIATANVTVAPADVAQPALMAGDYVLLTFSDSGTGIDKDIVPLVFEPFFTTKEQGKGTGLGLATVYGIVKQNLGFISVESEPGVGTTFRIHLPRHVGAVTAPASAPVAARPAKGAGPIVILLVEDEPTLLMMTARMLTRLGYRVLTAASPDEALRQAQGAEPIDLLVTDVVMPGMNGRRLAELLLQQKPGLKAVFMSGYTPDVIAPHGVLHANFLQKPFTSQELAAKVREALGPRWERA